MPTKSIQDARYQQAVEALRDGRVSTGLSQTELARLIGRSQQFVSKYESLERRLDVIEFIDVAKAVSVDWLETLAAIAK